MDRAEHDRQIRDAHRAIGHYVVAFSELISEIRSLIARRISPGEDWQLANIVLGESPAMPISHAFFWLCRDQAALTTEEERVASKLSSEVEKAIRTRNDVAHGDWHVGYLAIRSPVETLPPRLVRILPHQSEGPYKVLDLTVEDIDKMTERLLALITLVVEFGNLALGFPLTVSTEDGGGRTSVGELRVGDVLTLRPGGQDRPAEVVRDGPHATHVAYIPYL